MNVFQDKGVVSVDNWLRFRVSAKSATLVKHMRSQLEEMLLQHFGGRIRVNEGLRHRGEARIARLLLRKPAA